MSERLFPPSEPDAPRRRRSRRRVIWSMVAVLLVAALGIGAWVLGSAQHALDKATNGHGGSLTDVIDPKAMDAESRGAVNVLLAGNSFDDAGHDGADLTDSIMVAHFDVSSRKLTLVSIPRDLQVQYRGQWMKINQVYVSAGDGTAGLAALGGVTQQVTGLPIDRHALVGYTALKDLVDAVGGVDVTIHSNDPRGIHDAREQLTIANGVQHVNGLTALALCRARNDTPDHGSDNQNYGLPRGDVDRQANQRLVFAALMQRIDSSSTLANPVKLVDLFNTVGSHVTTDLTIGEMARLRQITSNSGSPVSISINGPDAQPLLTGHASTDLGDTLVPVAGLGRYDAIMGWVARSLG